MWALGGSEMDSGRGNRMVVGMMFGVGFGLVGLLFGIASDSLAFDMGIGSAIGAGFDNRSRG